MLWYKSGSPWIWLNGGAVTLCMIMVIGLLGLIAVRGFGHFWPADIALTSTTDNTGHKQVILGELVRSEVIPAAIARDNGFTIATDRELITRYLMKLGNRDITGRDFIWSLEIGMDDWTYPTNAVAIERREWGNFYGYIEALYEADKVVVSKDAANFVQEVDARLKRALELHEKITHIEKVQIGTINNHIQELKLEHRRLELKGVTGAKMAEADAVLAERKTALEAEYDVVKKERDALAEQAKRDHLIAKTADGKEVNLPLANLVRITRPNDIGVFAKLGDYLERFGNL